MKLQPIDKLVHSSSTCTIAYMQREIPKAGSYVLFRNRRYEVIGCKKKAGTAFWRVELQQAPGWQAPSTA